MASFKYFALATAFLITAIILMVVSKQPIPTWIGIGCIIGCFISAGLGIRANKNESGIAKVQPSNMDMSGSGMYTDARMGFPTDE
jgi:hypothetical protein